MIRIYEQSRAEFTIKGCLRPELQTTARNYLATEPFDFFVTLGLPPHVAASQRDLPTLRAAIRSWAFKINRDGLGRAYYKTPEAMLVYFGAPELLNKKGQSTRLHAHLLVTTGDKLRHFFLPDSDGISPSQRLWVQVSEEHWATKWSACDDTFTNVKKIDQTTYTESVVPYVTKWTNDCVHFDALITSSEFKR